MDTVNCNHRRATLLPISEPSLFNTCQLIAYECESYERFSEGECADCGFNEEKCKPLNLDTNYWDYADHNGPAEDKLDEQFSRQMFLQTSDMFPFCLYHYQIVVWLSPNVYVFCLKKDCISIGVYVREQHTYHWKYENLSFWRKEGQIGRKIDSNVE